MLLILHDEIFYFFLILPTQINNKLYSNLKQYQTLNLQSILRLKHTCHLNIEINLEKLYLMVLEL